jgi:hypothetical protein
MNGTSMEQNDQMPPGFWEQVSDTIDIARECLERDYTF